MTLSPPLEDMSDDVESALAGEGLGFSLIWRNDWFFNFFFWFCLFVCRVYWGKNWMRWGRTLGDWHKCMDGETAKQEGGLDSRLKRNEVKNDRQ